MKNLQVRHVPEATHAALRRRAAMAGMSLQEYLLAELTELVSRPTVEEVIARAGGRSGGKIGLAVAAADLAEDRGRP